MKNIKSKIKNEKTENKVKVSAEVQKDRDFMVRQFRGYLHLAITAQMIGSKESLEALKQGPAAVRYCRALAHLPEDKLATELAYPVKALLEQIKEVAAASAARMRRPDADSERKRAEDRQVLAGVDLALMVILRNLTELVKRRAAVTECRDLLGEVLMGWMVGEGGRLAGWIRRYQAMDPEEGRTPDGSRGPDSLPDVFARDVYERVEALDRLAEEFPDHVRTGAQRLPAWPMLGYRQAVNRPRLEELAERLGLGEGGSINASADATFEPDEPLTRYLIRLVRRLDSVCAELGPEPYETIESEQAMLLMVWYDHPEPAPTETVVELLRVARQLPWLTKETAAVWTERVIVPLILETDARNYGKCVDEGLRGVAKDKRVTGEETFRNCLLEAVGERMGRIARNEE